MTSQRYKYACNKCGGAVTKPPCCKTTETSAGSGLHGWVCDSCGRGIKVARTLRGAQ